MNKTEKRAYRTNPKVRTAIMHGRRTRKNGKPGRRYTLAVALDINTMSASVGIATCGDNDQFRKATGRAMAIDRAKRKLVNVESRWSDSDLEYFLSDKGIDIGLGPVANDWLNTELNWMIDNI